MEQSSPCSPVQAQYNKLLVENEVITPKHSSEDSDHDSAHAYHLYVVRMKDRKAAINSLRDAGIDFGIHYPTPIHLQPCYQYLQYCHGDFPNAETRSREILSLPMFPEISDMQIGTVVQTITRFGG